MNFIQNDFPPGEISVTMYTLTTGRIIIKIN